MKLPYKSRNPNAGVVTYEIVGDAIILEFPDRKFRYVYNADSPGAGHVQAMKQLAMEGKGLTTYVNQHVRDRYARKLAVARSDAYSAVR